jgi:hypothetical protein
MKTKDGRIVASNAPSRSRQMTRPVKLWAEAVAIVIMDQEIKLNMTQYFTGRTIRAYEDRGWKQS